MVVMARSVHLLGCCMTQSQLCALVMGLTHFLDTMTTIMAFPVCPTEWEEVNQVPSHCSSALCNTYMYSIVRTYRHIPLGPLASPSLHPLSLKPDTIAVLSLETPLL